jgi:hypothetical protein
MVDAVVIFTINDGCLTCEPPIRVNPVHIVLTGLY